MYDYDSKEEVSLSSPPATGKSIRTTIEFVYSPPLSQREIHESKANNKVRAASSTVSEDRKSNDLSYHHGDESPSEVPSSSSSSSLLWSSQAEDSIQTPIISNRPQQREAPPVLCLPPTLSSPNHLKYEHSIASVQAQVTTATYKPPRFSSISDEPIVMSGTTLESWKGRRNTTTTSTTTYHHQHHTLLSERLPAILDLVTFSNNGSNDVSSSALTTDMVRYSVESMVRMGFFFAMNRIKRTLFESNKRELQLQTKNFDEIKFNKTVVGSISNEFLKPKASPTITTAPLSNIDPSARSTNSQYTNYSVLQGAPSTKLPKPNNSTSDMLPTTMTKRVSKSASIISSRSLMKAVGIRNYGQTCFLNSVLQALASLDPFIMYLDRIVQLNVKRRHYLQMATSHVSVLCPDDVDDDDDDRNIVDSYIGRTFQSRKSTMTKGNCTRPGDIPKKSFFCEDVLTVLRMVNGEKPSALNHSSIDPRPILLAVGHKHKQFQRRYGGVGVVAVGEQQDAQELLQAVLGMIIDEGQFDITPPAIPSTVMSSFVENINDNCSNEEERDIADITGNESLFLYNNTTMHSSSKAMEIMMTTTSSTSPCPLSVWCGSALMCSSCRRVRPIQNVPFLDIPVVPTSISHQMMYPPRKGQDAPSCRLEDCLSEFTAIERVFDVECKNCTIQAEIEERVSDKEFQQQIINGIRSRQTKTHGKLSQIGDCGIKTETKHVVDDLHAIEAQIDYLRRLSPDDDRLLYKGVPFNTTIVALEKTPTTPTKIPFKRSDAFKCLLLTRLPSILSIHVQRRYFDPNTGKTSKTMQHINFPEMLDVSSFCAYGAPKQHHSSFAGTANNSRTKVLNSPASSLPIWYKLMAVIEHRGGPYSGHYVCFRRDPSAIREDRWLWISDDTVRVCQWSTVRNCQAYMLFYEAT